MIPNRALALLAVLLIPAVAGSCSLNPREDPTRYYVLTNIAEDPGLLGSAGEAGDRPSPGTSDSLGVRVGLRLTFPSYLDRTRMVTRLASNELQFMETDRWGEPLEEAFQYALGVNLGELLGTEKVILHPWYSTEKPEYVVRVDVIRFERDPQGAAHLVAQWELRGPEGGLLSSRGFEVTEPGDPASIASSVEAQSRAVAALSRQIADAIRKAAS